MTFGAVARFVASKLAPIIHGVIVVTHIGKKAMPYNIDADKVVRVITQGTRFVGKITKQRVVWDKGDDTAVIISQK